MITICILLLFQSILFAPFDPAYETKELALGYANRSAALYDIGQYQVLGLALSVFCVCFCDAGLDANSELLAPGQ